MEQQLKLKVQMKMKILNMNL